MNFPLFLSNRLRRTQGKSFTRTVSQIGVASIAVGLAVVIVAFAVLFGFKQTVQDKVFGLAAHLKVTKFTLNQSFEETPLQRRSPLAEGYRSIPSVRHLQGVAHKAGILKTKDDLQGAILKGVGPDFDWTGLRGDLIAGRLPQFSDSTDSKEVLLSRSTARKLKLGVGDGVVMYFLPGNGQRSAYPRARKLDVVGLYDSQLEEFNQLMIGDLRLVQKLNNWGPDTVGTYEIFVKNVRRLDAAATDVATLLSPDMDLYKVTDQYRPIFDWLLMLDRNATVFLVLILFVASFNMVSILLVMMMERTPMIGLLKALGSADGQIRRVFLYQGIAIVLRGLLWGNLLGLGLAFVQQRFRLIPLDPVNYYMDTVPITFDWLTVFLLNAATLGLVTLVLFIPTVIITRIRPSKAIVFNK
jgi:lipoprotein-releasing system permease protein